jgi:hypothetical protein
LGRAGVCVVKRDSPAGGLDTDRVPVALLRPCELTVIVAVPVVVGVKLD